LRLGDGDGIEDRGDWEKPADDKEDDVDDKPRIWQSWNCDDAFMA